MSSHWPKLRAALIFAALFFGLVDGIPIPPADVAAKLPVPARVAADFFRPIQSAILEPVKFVGDTFQFRQRWDLFTSSRADRTRLWVEARTAPDAPWEVLFRAHDAEHRAFAAELEYRRVRGIWNPARRHARAGYPSFVTWIARRIFETEARFHEVRVRLEQIQIVPEGPGFIGNGTFLYVEERRRSEVRP